MLHLAGCRVPSVLRDRPAVLARQITHQRPHILLRLRSGLLSAETPGHRAHQLIQIPRDRASLYHCGSSRPRFFLRHNSKITGRLPYVTDQSLSAQITISDCRTSTTVMFCDLNLHDVVSEPAFPVVAAAGSGLVCSAQVGPGECMVEGSVGGAGQVCQETADLGGGEGDQAAPAFGAWAAVTAR
jgi:hypothetical protein